MTDPTQRPRILITLPDLFLGGGQRIVLNYLRHRDRAAFDVRVLTLQPQPDDLAAEFADADVQVTCLHRTVGDRGAARHLADLLRRDGISLLHAHGPADTRLSLSAAFLTHVPMVLHLHSEWNHRGPRRPAHPGRLPRLGAAVKGRLRDRVEDRVVREYLADSAAVARAFRHRVRRPVHAMAQSVPLDELAAAAATHDDRAWRAELGLGPGPVAINVSRVEEGKGQARLIAALAAARRRVPDAQLLLVGDGDQRAGCERLVERSGLAGAVHVLGSRFDVPRLLVGADVFVFGSRTESFGLVVAEAMAARLPVVAYRLPSLADFVVDGVTGYFPAQDDDEGFADALADLLEDRVRAGKLGEAGHAVVAERFPPEATAGSFEDSYRRALGLTANGPRPGTLSVATMRPTVAHPAAPPPLKFATKG
jgi:glycosyltransferase involved in cell wall biosynthesis